MILSTGHDDAGRRLDRILRKALPDFPLSALHRLLRKGEVLVNGKTGKGEDRIPSGAFIQLPLKECDLQSGKKPALFHKQKKPSPLDILWEGGGLLILNKPAGLAVHGGSKSPDSLERQVQEYVRLAPSLSFRPGPLHRLDKPSSGIVVFALNLETAQWFSALLRERKIGKRYLAILEGTLAKSETWTDLLTRDKKARKTFVSPPGSSGNDRKDSRISKALTSITPLAWAKKNGVSYTLARIEIKTGRTHQIRTQAASRKHPLAGDRKYGGKPFFQKSFFLHGAELELPDKQNYYQENPEIIKAPKCIKAPLPADFSQTVRELFGILKL